MTAPIPDVEVLVVGAGPTGLTAALALALRGQSVRIIDTAPAPAGESRAALVHSAAIEILDRLGAGDRLVERSQRIAAVTLAQGSRVLARVGFEGLPSRYPFSLGVPQSTTEQVLIERLAETGVAVERGMTAVTVEQTDTLCTVNGRTADDRRWTVTASFVVAADGKNSTTRAAVGIPFETVPYSDDFVLADIALEPAPAPADKARIVFSPLGVTVIGRLPSGTHRIVATVATGTEAPREPDRRYIDELLAARGILSHSAADPIWASRFRIAHGVADSYSSGRVFLAGDAAHVHSPAAGQGMNTGIADGYALATLMADALEQGSQAPLTQYGPARRAAAEEVVRFTDGMTRAALLRSPVQRAIRNAALRVLPRLDPVRRRLVGWISGLARSPLRESER